MYKRQVVKEPTVIYMERPLKAASHTIHIEVPPNPFWASIGLSVTPVSYTHLDVYKRQEFGNDGKAHILQQPQLHRPGGKHRADIAVAHVLIEKRRSLLCLLYTSRCV